MKTGSKKYFRIEICKKALGIDICKTGVSFALLQKKGSQIKVVRAGNVPFDQTVVNNDVVQDATAVAELLKRLKIAGSFKHRDTTLVICAEPVLLQIMNLPDSAPGEVRKFIQDEVRQYAVLPLKNIEMDYCRLLSADSQTKRVLVGAAQTEHLSMTVKAIEKDNIDVQAIEPAITAFIRACYKRVIEPAGEKNVMLLLVRDDTLSLCVFEKQRLEFLRVKKFQTDIAGSQRRKTWLKNEVESVIQFYELEKPVKARSWQIIVADCPENKYAAKFAAEIRGPISRRNIEIATFENSLMDVVVSENDGVLLSPVAVGAAMKLLDDCRSGVKLNLLPKKIMSVKKTKKELLILANVAAGLLVGLLLLIAFMTGKSARVDRDICREKQRQPAPALLPMVWSKRDIEEKIRFTENNLITVSKVAGDKSWQNWGKLLTDLADITPQAVLVKNLQFRSNNTMEITGLAVSFEAINDFAARLGKNEQISSAQVISASQVTKFDSKLIDYSIRCSLVR